MKPDDQIRSLQAANKATWRQDPFRVPQRFHPPHGVKIITRWAPNIHPLFNLVRAPLDNQRSAQSFRRLAQPAHQSGDSQSICIFQQAQINSPNAGLPEARQADFLALGFLPSTAEELFATGAWLPGFQNN